MMMMYDTSSCVVAQLASINDQQQRPAGWLWREQTVKYQQVPSTNSKVSTRTSKSFKVPPSTCKNTKVQVKVSSIGNIAVVDIVDALYQSTAHQGHTALYLSKYVSTKSQEMYLFRIA